MDRDRVVDGLRALAILGVVCGHWLVGALVADPAGALRIDSPMRYLPWLHPATWVLQLLGLFFLVGGYSCARSLDRAGRRGQSDREWVGVRLRRLATPVLVGGGIVAVLLGLARIGGVPGGTLRTWLVLFFQPLWFIAVYAVITTLTPYLMRLDRRYGTRAALAGVGAVALVDLVRYGPGRDLVPDWFGYLTTLPAWGFAYLLGIAWARGRLGRRAAWSMLAGGLALFAFLLLVARYPVSIVSVPGSDRSNSNPPSLLVPALALIQIGAALQLRDRFERLLRRPGPWAVVTALNVSAMSIFCWHHTALVVVAEATRRVGVLPGMGDAPTGANWVLARLGWFPVLAATLAVLVLAVRRFEQPTGRRLPAGVRGAAGVAGGQRPAGARRVPAAR
ncbi:Acyltransferase family protein [Micromonospora sp. MW-13]|uniref:acyltransferase family protein n=1 Tax=unclassified Micromonospora TaxID=2617518 RepID=UPI000E452AF2|nr:MULTISPECIES: acyltransferase [unclassified Micromonospora]MCX4471682.1 acyltransferase [Micromonospora sp. NBC_01655]RGC66780.1 Acyltransferase family protein [Micromonospora sp. MW-13]